jgi:hypothetical protein
MKTVTTFLKMTLIGGLLGVCGEMGEGSRENAWRD